MPMGTGLGSVRFVIVAFLCHVAVLVLWPAAVALWRQKPGVDSIRVVALVAFCVWQAWQRSEGVVSAWMHIGHWTKHWLVPNSALHITRSVLGPPLFLQTCAGAWFRYNEGMQNPVIVALDVPRAEIALELAAQLAPVVCAFKIGSELFASAGPDIVRRIRASGAAVFLDLKFHDIPNTVARAVAAATRLDVQMLTVHTSGGLEMMQAAEQSAQQAARASGRGAPLVLGVTVLTSMDDNNLAEIGVASGVGAQVERLAGLAVKAGLRGLVCSPLEIAALRRILPAGIRLVTPGIRAGGGAKTDDQKRTLSAREARDAGADWLVIGRPIYAAQNPREATEEILGSLK
jgi:orotidine-5'-phosphate decarboxylase